MIRPAIRPPFPAVIDNSMRSDMVSCETKWYYAWLRKLGSPLPSIDLIAGGAFARGLEVVRLSYYGEKLSLQRSLELGMAAAIVEYGDIIVPDKKENKGPDRVITALAAYFERFPPDHDHIQPFIAPSGKPMVEFTFSIPLPVLHPETGEPIIYAGRFDMVGTFQGQLIGVDEKTTTQLGDQWKKSWNLRAQFTGYTWAMQQYDFPVIGIMVRGVSFLTAGSKVAWNGTGHGFEESLQLRPQYMIDDWYNQLIKDIERAKVAWAAGEFDQNLSDSCTAYSGCAFQDLCTSQDPEAFTSRYGIRDWDPLKKVPHVQPEQKIEVIAGDPYLTNLVQGN